MCIKGQCVITSDCFMEARNYINKRGEHPKYHDTIGWNRMVLKKEDLNDNNWLYVGDKDGTHQLEDMKFHKGFVPIVKIQMEKNNEQK